MTLFLFVLAEEKIDEYLQQLSDEPSNWSQHSENSKETKEAPYYHVLKEVASVLSGETISLEEKNHLEAASSDVPEEGERLIWQSIHVLSNSRPPASFVVYDRSGKTSTQSPDAECQPVFDGHVANATPPPLGPPGRRPSAGAGTLLHLACAMDSPFALAVFLALGADARSPHTAFRRLMIHEAACSGSIQCLTLLLELGKECALQLYKEHHLNLPSDHEEQSFNKSHIELPFFRFENPVEMAMSPLTMSRKQIPSFGLPKKPKVPETKGWLEKLKHFYDLAKKVRAGVMSEMDAARTVLAFDTIATPSRQILAQSCSFLVKDSTMSGNPFNCPWYADGHGNTPLHWAAFKNEVECVSMLLKYHADPNSRAHPSGWTPLHDAAYSNSTESAALLLNAGADVDIRANSGASPLCFAAQEDAEGAARLLLERGADLSIRCAGGPRIAGYVDAVHPLLPFGRFSGYTPLHYCAHYNAHRAARALLSHPSSRVAMEILDLSDRLPIHVAVARGSSDVLRELLHAGARIETPQSPPSSPGGDIGSDDSRSGSPTRRAAVQELPSTPTHSINRSLSDDSSVSSVASPVLRSMIPARPISSSKPWNCLTQKSIDECKRLLSQAEQHWAPDRHRLFTPADRRAVMELLRVGKRLELTGSGIFIDLWPLVLSFCGRGWFEVDNSAEDFEMGESDCGDSKIAAVNREDTEDADRDSGRSSL